jgi:hypothetical protein
MQIRCSEPNCPENVDYEPDVVPGVDGADATDVRTKEGTKRVYLTCPLGHTHVYVVSV